MVANGNADASMTVTAITASFDRRKSVKTVGNTGHAYTIFVVSKLARNLLKHVKQNTMLHAVPFC